ncbi:YceI family protein [Rapidithrix thailandica]|uniref:YceI family protein n=1 Tax=Rapidithrix thailandica TaxID=413964 RepID=A0AAW9RVG9_9BACT
MKSKELIFRVVLLSVSSCILWICFAFTTDNPVKFVLTDQSKVILKGTTNINQFTCLTANIFTYNQLQLFAKKNNKLFTFKGAEFFIEVTDLDCGGRVINNDLQKTLQAEKFPQIQLHLKQAEVVQALEGNRAKISTQAMISIAGQSKLRNIDLQVIQLNEDTLHIEGSHQILMSEYGITPPKPMLGLIKVHDPISITFDLKVALLK